MTMDPVIKLQSGGYFNYLDPENSPIRIEDIAHALSHLCRFAGHTNTFYSVGQHSLHVSTMAQAVGLDFENSMLGMQGLMHDASEAVMVDIPSPLKRMLPDYRKLEHAVEAGLMRRFQVDYPFPPAIKQADLIMLATERRDLLPGDRTAHWEWLAETAKPASFSILPLPPEMVRERFLERYYSLRLKIARENIPQVW